MHKRTITALILTMTLAASAFAQKPKGNAKTSAAARIASALSAAPSEIASGAKVVEMGAGGKMTTLRAGTNGWLCVPDDPSTPGPDPMCIDKVWQEWLNAYMAKKAPETRHVGIAYMLAGGADASNTDPYASKPAPGEKWVMSPAHMMVLMPETKMLDSYPGNSNTGGPYIMWKGTPYAHLMVPVDRKH